MDLFPFLFVWLLKTTWSFSKAEEYTGKVCAFVDVNFDQYTDIVSVDETGRKITVYIASREESIFSENVSFQLPAKKTKKNMKVVNCAAGDFDGDSFPDLLLSLAADQKSGELIDQVCVCFLNSDSKFLCDYCEEFDDQVGQPTILDCNNDYLSDFFIPYKNGSGICFSYHNRTDFSRRKILNSTNPKLLLNYVPSYVEIDGNYDPELILGVWDDNKELGLAVWKMEKGSWVRKNETFPKTLLGNNGKLFSPGSGVPKAYGQPIVGDFDGNDGLTEVIIPACLDDDCSQVELMLLKNWKWTVLTLNLTDNEKTEWKLPGLMDSRRDGNFKIVTSRIGVGDYTLDGYPDLLLTLESTAKNEKRVFLARNVPCSNCNRWTRNFQMMWSPVLVSGIPDGGVVTRAAFFDLSEDGNLDILLEYEKENVRKFRILMSEDKGDTSFVKAEVFTATCSKTYKGNHDGSGISAPGGVLFYESSDENGKEISGKHTQLSQTAYGSLQLPYALFGIGRTPNFVEKLTVAIPSNISVSQTWVQIVPNARLYVIPCPPDQPKKWESKLYLTPSRLILLSFAALCCVCGVILLFIVVLHWRERYQDKLEKQQQAHKFNFDAM